MYRKQIPEMVEKAFTPTIESQQLMHKGRSLVYKTFFKSAHMNNNKVHSIQLTSIISHISLQLPHVYYQLQSAQEEFDKPTCSIKPSSV